jgi:DNA modification methylase
VTPYLQDPDMTLWHGDVSEVLSSLWTSSVDCIVTSPPYADARGDDYECVSPDAYPAWFSRIADDFLRVLSDSGSMLLNLGRIFRDSRESSYVERTLIALEDRGWARIDTLIWHKLNALPNQHRELRRMHEYVYWLAKTPDAYRGIDDVREPYADSSRSRYTRNFKSEAKNRPREESGRDMNPLGAKPGSVFTCTVGRERGNPHPAPMALDLAEHLVRLGCPEGGTVLDPFAGSGTTLLAARKHGRVGVGVELSEAYCEIAAKRLSQLSLLAELRELRCG